MTVKVYSATGCVHCERAKKFLEENNVDFESVNVAQDQLAAREMMDLTGQRAVPVIDYDGEIIIGFDKEKLKELV